MRTKTWVTQPPKKSDNIIIVGIDLAKLPSHTHKWGAINNRSKVFDDRRKRKPKYKINYMED